MTVLWFLSLFLKILPFTLSPISHLLIIDIDFRLRDHNRNETFQVHFLYPDFRVSFLLLACKMRQVHNLESNSGAILERGTMT